MDKSTIDRQRVLDMLAARQVTGVRPGMAFGAYRVPVAILKALQKDGLCRQRQLPDGLVYVLTSKAIEQGLVKGPIPTAAIELSFTQSRALHRAGLVTEASTGGKTLGSSIYFGHAAVLAALGLLEKVRLNAYRITGKGRIWLQAHPHQENIPVLQSTPQELATARQQTARAKLAILFDCQLHQKCIQCGGTGHQEPPRNRWQNFGGWQHFSAEEYTCTTCGGSGKAPGNKAYGLFLAAMKNKYQADLGGAS